VSRRLYRTGESEYVLNNNACCLREVIDLFAGTGASPRAYSVMDQDKLNHVLTAKPHERRVFVEEAAGIARYKQQRNETQGKLDAARQNLVRVRDVMDEVKRQLNSLERQARKAQQYKALQTEKRTLALALAAVGIYGILTFMVSHRRREIGIRLAVGAEPAAMLRMIVREGVGLALAGCAIGLVGAFVGGRTLSGFLYSVPIWDPATLGGVLVVVLVVATAACVVPGRRAAAEDPVSALRAE